MSHSPFLDMSEDVRLHIYGLVGRVSARVIPLNNVKAVHQRDSNRLDCSGSYEYDYMREHQLGGSVEDEDQTLQSLFRTCRQTYFELSRLIYSRNRVGVRNSEPGTIDKLLLLSPYTASCLTNLTVRLNDQRPRAARLAEAQKLPHPQYNVPLDDTAARDMETVCRWQRCARFIFTHTTPYSLTLNFICDTQSSKLASLATEPFFKVESLLRACNIKLSHSPRRDFHLLAREASLHATGNQVELLAPHKRFPFMKLPKELRLQILQYTDLVTPLCEVEWKPDYAFHMHYGGAAPCIKPDLYEPWLYNPCKNGRIDGIFIDSEDGMCPSMHIHCKSRACCTHVYAGCFCHRYHGAYTEDCRCWIPPTSLFLVCRTLRDDSIETFYSKNRFVVTPKGKTNYPANNDIKVTSIETFLTSVVPRSGRKFLKHLQIVFPPFSENYTSLQHSSEDRSHLPEATLNSVTGEFEPIYQSWLRALSIMSADFSLPAIKLEVFVAGWHRTKKINQGYYRYRKNLTEEQGKAVEHAYVDVFESLVNIRGVRDLFVYLDWPWTGKGLKTEWEADRYAQIHDVELRSTKEVEKRIERHAMGDNYDSLLRGKTDYIDNIGWRYDSGLRYDNGDQPWPWKHDAESSYW